MQYKDYEDDETELPPCKDRIFYLHGGFKKGKQVRSEEDNRKRQKKVMGTIRTDKPTKKCLVITKYSANGQYIHSKLEEKFHTNELRVNELADEMLGYYHCSKTAARKALFGLDHKDLVSIENYEIK